MISLSRSATLLLTGALASLLLPGLSGCRFGNRVSTTDPNADPFSGYYDTQPQKLSFCGTHGTTHCADVATNQVPVMVSDEMTNPTAFVVRDMASGSAVFVAAQGGQSALPVLLNTDDRTLLYASNGSAQTLWRDPHCTSKLYLEEEGALVAGPANAVAGSTRKTSGRVKLRVRVTEVYDETVPGACATTLTAMKNCYLDYTQCGGADTTSNQTLQSEIQDVFNPYIQAGAMTANDIPTTTNIAYEVQYQ